MHQMGSRVQYPTVYRPQSNSAVERANRTIIEMVTAYTNDHGSNWEEYIPLLEFAYNTSVKASTGYTPFRLTTGREAVFPVTLHETTHITRTNVKQFINDYDATLTAARDRIADAKLTAALHPPQPRKPHSFQPGDQVLLSTEHLSCRNHKFSKPWIGPFQVLTVYGNALELDL